MGGDFDKMPMQRATKYNQQDNTNQNSKPPVGPPPEGPPPPTPPPPFPRGQPPPPGPGFNPMMVNPDMMNNPMMNNPMMGNPMMMNHPYMGPRGPMMLPFNMGGPFPPDMMNNPMMHQEMLARKRFFGDTFQGGGFNDEMGFDYGMYPRKQQQFNRKFSPPQARHNRNNNFQPQNNQNFFNSNGAIAQGNQNKQNIPQAPTRGQANDYSQNFVDTNQRPQNFLQDATMKDIYEDYPHFKRLITLKNEKVAATNTPPYCLKADLKELKLNTETFGTRFDVILIDPPWEEYVKRAPGLTNGNSWSWREIEKLDIASIADNPSFIFLWCGSNQFLDAARHCLKSWGFRRCEDICWVKTNRQERKIHNTSPEDQDTILQHTKEHCLMGIRGTVRRNVDGHLIHANCDTDVIVAEEPLTPGSTKKPEDMYQIIERFSLGKRRLELFGEDHNIRPGWVTIGNNLMYSNFNPQTYSQHFKNKDGSVFVQYKENQKVSAEDPNLGGTTEEIENLRPKSPPPNQGNPPFGLNKPKT